MHCGGHFHHYCAGLRLLARNRALGEAVGEFQYLSNGCAADSPIKPEILTNQGCAYIGLDEYDNAVDVLTEAIRRNPKYVAAYAELSGLYLRLNSRDDARKILEDGLKVSPGSTYLQARLARIDGPDEEERDDTEGGAQDDIQHARWDWDIEPSEGLPDLCWPACGKT